MIKCNKYIIRKLLVSSSNNNNNCKTYVDYQNTQQQIQNNSQYNKNNNITTNIQNYKDLRAVGTVEQKKYL